MPACPFACMPPCLRACVPIHLSMLSAPSWSFGRALNLSLKENPLDGHKLKTTFASFVHPFVSFVLFYLLVSSKLRRQSKSRERMALPTPKPPIFVHWQNFSLPFRRSDPPALLRRLSLRALSDNSDILFFCHFCDLAFCVVGLLAIFFLFFFLHILFDVSLFFFFFCFLFSFFSLI